MKRYKTTIIALVLIVVCVAGYFIVRKLDLRDSSPEPSATPQNPSTSSVFPFGTDADAADRIARIECQTKDNIVLEKQGGEWICTSYPELQVLSKNVSAIIRRMCSYGGPLVFEGEMTEAVRSQFGLDGEEKITVTMNDGTVYTVIFGGLNTSGGACYTWLEGTEQIYLCSLTFRDYMMLTKVDLISATVFDFTDSGQINRVSISKNGENFVRLSATLSGVVGEARTWTMEYPLSRKADKQNTETLVASLLNISIEDIAVSNCEDLAAYGLSPAEYSVSVTSPEKTVSLQIGSRTKDGSGYYFTVNGGSDVYTVSSSKITFKDESSLVYMDQFVFMVMYTELSKVELTLDGKTHTLGFDYANDEENFYFDGVCATKTNADYEDEFRSVLTAVYQLELAGIDPEPSEPGEVLCEIRYEQSDGTVTTVVCTARSETTMYYYLNGEYVGGYGNRWLLTSDGNKGIRGAVKTLMSCLNLSE